MPWLSALGRIDERQDGVRTSDERVITVANVDGALWRLKVPWTKSVA